MRRNFIETLHCPFSGSAFQLSNVVAENNSDIEYGIITSEAGDFPIVGGILRLKVDDYRAPIVSLIKRKKPAEALLTALDVPSFDRIGAAVNFLDRTAARMGLDRLARCSRAIKKPLCRALTDPGETLVGTAKRLKSESWANWQIYRFSMPAFLPVYPFLHLMEGDGPVLDFGCGVGHASFLISRRVDISRITCADDQFSALYLAQKFLVGGANLICLDGDYLLPFDSGYFKSVFSSDVLHLIDSKLSLCQEFRRIVSQDGTIILPHLHNKLFPVQFAKSLTPGGYSNLFAGIEKRIMPEDWLVDQFLSTGILDLQKEWSLADLHEGLRGLSIVVSNNPSLFRQYSGLWDRHIERMRHPIVNPAYDIAGHAGEWILSKHVTDFYGTRNSVADGTYLPSTITLTQPSLEQPAILSLKASDRTNFTKLARTFVFIEAPERFL